MYKTVEGSQTWKKQSQRNKPLQADRESREVSPCKESQKREIQHKKKPRNRIGDATKDQIERRKEVEEAGSKKSSEQIWVSPQEDRMNLVNRE